MKQDLFYKKCALLLKKVLTKRMTLKNACYSTNNPKQYFAVIKNTLDNLQMIEQVYNQLKHKKENEKYDSFIKIYEILSKNYKQNDKFFKEVQNFVKDLNLKKKEECIKYFRINNLEKKNISFSFEETDIKNVYKTKEILDYKLINEGKIIVQNYSSCLPAQILNPPEGSTVLDVCAAPGNKTLHLAQIMKNTGKIYAIEKDCKRFLILEKLVNRSGFTNITTIQEDCLSVDTSLFKDVKYVLVDPSCSGSGLHSIYSKNEERVKNLQKFQIAVINHFLKINSVNKLVYSTCSEHEEENEEVVKLVLENNFDFELEKITGYNLGRGNIDYDFSDKVIRVKRNEEENITGFFVALFVRKK